MIVITGGLAWRAKAGVTRASWTCHWGWDSSSGGPRWSRYPSRPRTCLLRVEKATLCSASTVSLKMVDARATVGRLRHDTVSVVVAPATRESARVSDVVDGEERYRFRVHALASWQLQLNSVLRAKCGVFDSR